VLKSGRRLNMQAGVSAVQVGQASVEDAGPSDALLELSAGVIKI
jgi:hypothetical protein